MYRLVLFSMLVLPLCMPVGTAEGATISRTILKTCFETGNRPTENQFVDLIDSLADLSFEFGSFANGHAVNAVAPSSGIALDGLGIALSFDEGQTFNPDLGILASFVSIGSTST